MKVPDEFKRSVQLDEKDWVWIEDALKALAPVHIAVLKAHVRVEQFKILLDDWRADWLEPVDKRPVKFLLSQLTKVLLRETADIGKAWDMATRMAGDLAEILFKEISE